MRETQHADAHREDRDERAAGGHVAPGQPRDAERRNTSRDQHEHRLGDQKVPGGALGVDEGGPAGGAAQDLDRVEPRGGH